MAAVQQPENATGTPGDSSASPGVGVVTMVEGQQTPPAQGAERESGVDTWVDDTGNDIFPSLGPLGRPRPLEEDDGDIPSTSDTSRTTTPTVTSRAWTLTTSSALTPGAASPGALTPSDCRNPTPSRSHTPTGSLSAMTPSDGRSHTPSRSHTPTFRNRRRSSSTSEGSSIFSLSSPAKMKFRAALNISLSFFGTGAFSLPKGIAAFETDLTRDLLVAAVLCCGVAFFAGSGFFLVGYISEQSKAKSYIECWVKTVGRSCARWFVIAALVFEQYVAGTIACAMILADSCVSLASPLKAHLPDGMHWLIERVGVLLIISLLAYPIVVQKDFRRLMNLSILATVAFAMVVVVILIRYFDGSYAPGGQYWEFQVAALEEATQFNGSEFPLLQIMILVSVLSNALCGHASAPAICRELPLERVRKGQVMEGGHERNARMIAGVVAAGFAGGCTITVGSMISGYLLFGVAAKGKVQESFHPNDPLGIAAKVMVTSAIFMIFPLKFKPLRDYIFNILDIPYRKKRLFRAVTAVQLAAITGPAVFLTDLGFLQAIVGATLSIFVAYFAPALMMCVHTKALVGRGYGVLLGAWAIFCLITGLVGVLSKYE